MSLLDQISGLLSSEQEIFGEVVAVDRVLVRVATRRGIVEATKDGQISIGDRVVITNRRARKLQRGTEKLFYV